ncbi:MAG: BrnT family toxin [Rhizobiaceae bacterium]
MLQFEWDEAKRQRNIKSHGVDFEEAIPLFDDDNALETLDERFSYGEERWLLIGQSAGRLLAVVYVERNGVHRIISVRPANRKEVNAYAAQNDRWL